MCKTRRSKAGSKEPLLFLKPQCVKSIKGHCVLLAEWARHYSTDPSNKVSRITKIK